MEEPKRVAANFMPGRFLSPPEALWTRIGTRRTVGRYAFAPQHLLDAEDVVAIAHGQAGMHAVDIHNGADPARGFGGIVALSLRDKLAVGEAKGLEVLAANHAFTEAGIAAGAAGNDHHGRQAAMVKLCRLVEPRFVHRGGTTVILSRAKYDDCVRGARFIAAGLLRAAPVHHCRIADRQQDQKPQQPFLPTRGCHADQPQPNRRNSARSLSGITPRRRTVICPGSLILMMVMRVPSCCRTPSAVVHSLAPLMLAEVAVMGTPAARITSTAMREAGTRSATLPVFAVTFSGNRDDAFTMIVSGPGQYLRVMS